MKQTQLNKIIDNIPVSKVYEHGYECRIVVTGTFLLYLHGLVDNYNDVDILIIDAPESFWSELFSNDYKWDIRDYGDYKSIKVKIDDVTYNLIGDHFYDEPRIGYLDCNEEIETDNLIHALKAKMKLNREKDREHFEGIITRLNSLVK